MSLPHTPSLQQIQLILYKILSSTTRPSHDNTTEIQLESSESGIYFVHIYFKKNSYVEKVIITN